MGAVVTLVGGPIDVHKFLGAGGPINVAPRGGGGHTGATEGAGSADIICAT